MGAGIAVLFKKKFGGVQELLNQREFWKALTWFALARAPFNLLHFNKENMRVKRGFLRTKCF